MDLHRPTHSPFKIYVSCPISNFLQLSLLLFLPPSPLKPPSISSSSSSYINHPFSLSQINIFNVLFCSLVSSSSRSKLHHLLNGNGKKENRDSKYRIEGPFEGDIQQTTSWIVQESPRASLNCSRKPMRFLNCAGQLLLSLSYHPSRSLSLSLSMETLMR